MLLSHLLHRANTLRHSPTIYTSAPSTPLFQLKSAALKLNSSSFITAEKASAFHRVDHSSPEDLHVGRSALDISVSLSAIGIFVLPASGSVKVSTQLDSLSLSLTRSIRIFMETKILACIYLFFFLLSIFFFFDIITFIWDGKLLWSLLFIRKVFLLSCWSFYRCRCRPPTSSSGRRAASSWSSMCECQLPVICVAYIFLERVWLIMHIIIGSNNRVAQQSSSSSGSLAKTNIREREKQILDKILQPNLYDRRIRPSGANGTGKEKRKTYIRLIAKSVEASSKRKSRNKSIHGGRPTAFSPHVW